MLLIFLILFTKVTADSYEENYVDLLPDEEKKEFIDKVARRILKDVESKENGKTLSGEISDEQLQKHNEYVKSILKQESENIRRTKPEAPNDKEEKPPVASDEILDVKPLETEKIADDADLEQLDLTLRNDRRGSNFPHENSSDYIKVEIVTENAPIIKRSIQHEFNEDENSDEKDSTTTSSKNFKTELELSETNELETVQSVPVDQTTIGTAPLETIAAGSKPLNSTTGELMQLRHANKSLDSKSETIEHSAITTNDSKIGEPTTTGSVNENKRSETDEAKSDGSSETGGEDIQVRVMPKTRRANFDSVRNASVEIASESVQSNSGAEYFGVKSIENKSDEYNGITSTGTEEFTTVTYPTGLTTVEVEAITQNMDKLSEKYNVTVYHSARTSEKDENATENLTENTLTSTMTDEGTSTFVIDTSTYKSWTEKLSTYVDLGLNKNNTEYVTENTNEPVVTTKGIKIVVKDFTSADSVESLTKSIPKDQEQTKQLFEESQESTTTVTTSEQIKEESTTAKRSKPKIKKKKVKKTVNIKQRTEESQESSTTVTTSENIKVESTTTKRSKPKRKENKVKIKVNIKQRTEESQESTTTVTASEKIKEDSTTTKRSVPKIKENKVKKIINTSIKVKDDTKIGDKNLKETTSQQLKNEKVSESANKNFIELEKVYYNKQKPSSKPNGKEYIVYEIPANESPFIKDKKPILEQPYYVPIYNYSPNNAYFNPQNRLGPNANDDTNEQVIPNLELIENANTTDNDEVTQEEKRNQNIEYLESAFDNQRKKFRTNRTNHSIHKMPQQNNKPVKKHSIGKVNPADYVDSDYYFGKLRKYLERRVNDNEGLFPNSDEDEHPTHSIQEMNLKDHVRAVRNILFQQKFFGPLRSRETEIETEIKPDINVPKHDKYLIKNGLYDNNNKNNIAIDYYFGRMKPATTSQSTNTNNDQILKKVGYITNRNDTEELYVIDKFFKENVVKYVQKLSNDNNYGKDALKNVAPFVAHKLTNLNFTPHPAYYPPPHVKPHPAPHPVPHSPPLPYQTPKKINKPMVKANEIKNIKGIQKLRNEEKKRNAFPSKTPLQTVESIPDGKDLFLDIEEMNLKFHRRYEKTKVSVYLDVLREMLSMDNKALVQYDWLGTTVDIQSSLQKLFELVSLAKAAEDIHPADLEILNYVLFLHKLAGEIVEANDFGAQLRKKLALPRNKKTKGKPHFLKEKGLLNRVWLYLRKRVPEINEYKALQNFNKLLLDIEDSLYDLHEAIKNVAKVTKYKNQHWYQNLKDLYLDTDEKHLLELLLHMSVSRLYYLIEESAKNGLEDDYVKYMKKNKKEAKRTLEELLFVTQILDEINKNVE